MTSFFKTIRTSGCQKGFNDTRDDQVVRWHWQQSDDGQTICTSLQTDNHARQAKLRDPTLTCAILGAFVESQTQCKELHEYPVYCAVHILCVWPCIIGLCLSRVLRQGMSIKTVQNSTILGPTQPPIPTGTGLV